MVSAKNIQNPANEKAEENSVVLITNPSPRPETNIAANLSTAIARMSYDDFQTAKNQNWAGASEQWVFYIATQEYDDSGNNKPQFYIPVLKSKITTIKVASSLETGEIDINFSKDFFQTICQRIITKNY